MTRQQMHCYLLRADGSNLRTLDRSFVKEESSRKYFSLIIRFISH
jgi:hypothetical protein